MGSPAIEAEFSHHVRLGASRFELDAVTQAVLERAADRTTIFVYWHDELLSNVLLPLHWRAASVKARVPACAANDSFGGQVIAACLGRLGVPIALLRRQSQRETKLQQMADALRMHRHLLLAADYGKPWFRARPTALQLARATGATIVTMHVSAERPWAFRRGTHRVVFPRPFGAYALQGDRI